MIHYIVDHSWTARYLTQLVIIFALVTHVNFNDERHRKSTLLSDQGRLRVAAEQAAGKEQQRSRR